MKTMNFNYLGGGNYVSPQVDVSDIEPEGVLCMSTETEQYELLEELGW